MEKLYTLLVTDFPAEEIQEVVLLVGIGELGGLGGEEEGVRRLLGVVCGSDGFPEEREIKIE